MKTFKTLRNDFFENRWWILFGLIALLIVDILQLFIPRVIKYAIDDLTLDVIPPSRLFFYGLEVFILALGIGGFRYVWRYFLGGGSSNRKDPQKSPFYSPPSTLPFLFLS
jgi:ATP-binding cassette subfamily B protein